MRRNAVTLAAGVACVLGAVAGGAALGGCEERAAAPAQAAATPDETYTVRGVVRMLPDPSKPASQLQIHHEEIPTFVGVDGKVVGMHEMTMPFPLAPGTQLGGVKVGDKVEFTFEVFRTPRMRYHLTRIATLPPETELNLKKP